MTHTSTAFTSDLADRFSDRVQGFGSPFTHYGGRRAFHGVVETVRCPADAGLIRSCLAEPGRGRVLVVDAGGSTRVAVLGDKMAALGLGNGWAGVLVNGAIRDCETLSRIDFGVLALGVVPIRGGLQGAGERGVELDFAGIAFRRGGYVYADADGVLISDVALM